MDTIYKTREEWLVAFAKASEPIFESHGMKLPPVRMSVGFTSKGAKSKRIGECWTDKCSKDGVCEIFIVPALDNAARVADILTHELIHAAVGIEHGHKAPFVRGMKAMGLEGKPTATVAGSGWWSWAQPILDDIGVLPHAALSSGSSGDKKQTTRMLKCECESCGFTFRTTAKWLEAAPEIVCPNIECQGMLNIG